MMLQSEALKSSKVDNKWTATGGMESTVVDVIKEFVNYARAIPLKYNVSFVDTLINVF